MNFMPLACATKGEKKNTKVKMNHPEHFKIPKYIVLHNKHLCFPYEGIIVQNNKQTRVF